jgi:hypothetical protein
MVVRFPRGVEHENVAQHEEIGAALSVDNTE